MSTHLIEVVCEGVCPETDLTVFIKTYEIEFFSFPASGDGWNEPREGPLLELGRVRLISPIREKSTYIVGSLIEEWAAVWFEQHQAECWAQVQADVDQGMEWQAEQRAEMRETFDDR